MSFFVNVCGGKERLFLFAGYVVDLAKAIQDIIPSFNYKFEVVPDALYGSLVNGTWDGMVGQLVSGVM